MAVFSASYPPRWWGWGWGGRDEKNLAVGLENRSAPFYLAHQVAQPRPLSQVGIGRFTGWQASDKPCHCRATTYCGEPGLPAHPFVMRNTVASMGISPSASPAHPGNLVSIPGTALHLQDVAVEPSPAIPPPDPLILALQDRFGVDASITHPAEALLTPLWPSADAVHQLFLMHRQRNERRCPAVPSVTEAIAIAAQYAAKGYDAYHACGEFVTPDNRKASNASGAAALWLDLDCGPEKGQAGKGYLTKVDAFQGVMTFCEKTQLPTPTHIVDSGGGLHCYWVFARTIPADRWRVSAAKFKQLTNLLGLRADDARTADIASVLRLPGTLNFKTDPPHPVSLLYVAPQLITE